MGNKFDLRGENLYLIPLGWGKEFNGVLKNHYPKGLRINY